MTAWPDWFDHAACKDMGAAKFFPQHDAPGRGGQNRYQAAVAEALKVCAACPVRDDCLDWAAKHNETLGIWGGLTAGQRGARRFTRTNETRAGAA